MISIAEDNLVTVKKTKKKSDFEYIQVWKDYLKTKIESILACEIKNLVLFDYLCNKISALMEYCTLFNIPLSDFEIDMKLLINEDMKFATGLIFSVKLFFFT